ncbi:cytochrome c oxidase assembly protein COX16 homolog l(3)neo43 isoform X2 [Lycorma delicatula]|uniref:cytochrome c oxidase assembly protein COX16 homolog l(3)neo43 isoform X2 n=1 Tax=Lycorma delicatula TaxID=130591 RepID=UPI003F51A801
MIKHACMRLTIMVSFNKLSSNTFFKHGLPFLIIVVGGSFALKQFSSLRYQFSRNEKISPEEQKELDKMFLKPSEYNIETEYEKLKQMDIDNWENKRIPRPWEENE